MCAQLHALVRTLPRLEFPPPERQVSANGLYIFFERGEVAHDGDRITRIGSHTGHGNLLARLREHVTHNKDRSIFRKNVGRALLSRARDPFLADWNLDLTSHAARALHAGRVDMAKQAQVEEEVTTYIRTNFTFSIIGTPDATAALALERRCIATVASCPCCHPSPEWLGSYSPLRGVREGGLWQVQHLRGEVIDADLMHEIEGYAGR